MPVKVKEDPLFEVLAEMDVPTLKESKLHIDGNEAKKSLSTRAGGERRGCYIFVISKQNSLQPWYVGKATKNFAQEVFNPGNINKYNNAMAKAGGGKPKIFFLALPSSKGPPNAKAIGRLENMLIEDCGGQNPNIENKHKTAFYKIRIAGVVGGGKGKPSAVASKVRKVTGRS